ncbi:MAG: RNA-processing protein [Methanobrevibacter sp.]|uniref:RNA-processing protein n=1 Tax=Methanobrevibacter millerae TaxID=230361 RepID=A0A8T3VJ72_9EURY|nr:KH domain-containing protein [Methanobrevibacter millerae]MBE6504720.1 RNA-processing protein [Methanobrevibacter millerae]MBR0059103.1 RNA-processing protein [Methanobrevibacter sp.]MBR0369547.1 RNA-processing protein [Methanobrevibacter sp.]
MPETDYLKIPQNRVGALIGTNGDVKKSIEKLTGTIIDIDSDDGTVYITPREDMEDPLGVWNANHIVKAVARGFNPEVAMKLIHDDIYLEIMKLPLYIGKSKKALARYKGRIIGKNGKTRELITELADVDMAVYGKTVSLIGEMDNVLIAKEAVEMILNGSRHKSVYAFLENKKETLKLKEFKDLVGIHDDKIEFKDGIDFDEETLQ